MIRDGRDIRAKLADYLLRPTLIKIHQFFNHSWDLI